jgi:hypothetical protein
VSFVASSRVVDNVRQEGEMLSSKGIWRRHFFPHDYAIEKIIDFRSANHRSRNLMTFLVLDLGSLRKSAGLVMHALRLSWKI